MQSKLNEVALVTDLATLEKVVSQCMVHVTAPEATGAAVNPTDRSSAGPHVMLLRAAYARIHQLRSGGSRY